MGTVLIFILFGFVGLLVVVRLLIPAIFYKEFSDGVIHLSKLRGTKHLPLDDESLRLDDEPSEE